MKLLPPNIWLPPISVVWLYLVGSQQTYFQLRAAFLSLAPAVQKQKVTTPLAKTYLKCNILALSNDHSAILTPNLLGFEKKRWRSTR